MMWLCDSSLIRLQYHLSPVIVYMQCSQDENQSRECLQNIEERH